MIIGVPREIKEQEYRVAITPAGVAKLTGSDHRVLIETGAGVESGIDDDEYYRAGAEILASPDQVWTEADMVVKVKEPLAAEYRYLRQNLLIFTFLHLAPQPELTEALLESGVTAIAYETVEGREGNLPLLAPMSEVAGRLATQVGARFLEKENGGRGILLGGATGASPGKILVLGSGTVGSNAALIGLGIGARVVMMGRNLRKLADRKKKLGERLITAEATSVNISREIVDADLMVGAVLVPGGRAPRLVTREMVAKMAKDSVIVDVAIDQGGCVETSRPTTHSRPTYRKEGVIHYCVANMPGAVPRTSTFALTNATLPYVAGIAASGLEAAACSDDAIRKGINVFKGKLINERVAAAQDRQCTDIVKLWGR